MQKFLFILILLSVGRYTSAQEVTINESFENITTVEINTIFSDIEIYESEGNKVTVDGYVRYSNSNQEYEIKAIKKGTTLYVSVEHPKRSKGNASGKFKLTMPAMTDVSLNTVSGNVIIQGVGQKFVKFNTVSGDVLAEKIGSNLKGNTVSGDIEVKDIKGNLKLSSISGDQSISDVDGNFDGSSISGDFRINNLKGNRNISTISGSVR
ncbi:DUF4097 family beta strand repeat-containing protein [Carboxylicivirga linearis]|uniref:DUF4097 family beta strand repeat protein n=1 Tax=Carboxylicivirga linearis TaxID=1628157 RepID=A0ABS5JS91_9BACT|nr:DUF4097 family beta strand repeat-containing protein [Carboxylicivirga linearis]MBS2097740.1 DUF4097 family beta strand repeat protein [Carboxylicivirga linearis]